MLCCFRWWKCCCSYAASGDGSAATGGWRREKRHENNIILRCFRGCMLLHVRDSSKLSGNQKEMKFLLSICAPWCYLSENQARVCMEKSLKIVRKSENAGINLMLCWKVVTANLHIYMLESTVYDSSYAERLQWLASLPWRDTCNYSPTMKNLTLCQKSIS